ncbi:soluble quino protein glucose dehydrogenase, partial [Aureobasidium melanogenum]
MTSADFRKLNHGIAFDNKNRMLYASNTNETYGWQYDSSAISVSNQQTLSAPGMLVISFGSLSNLDLSATNVDSGTASVKAFNLTNRTSTYTYQTDGLLLGWGLRNEVGLAEHPGTGGIWGVENSADQITRHGVDVHATNPGEELNFLGYVNGTESKQEGSNFGYPWCFSAWNPSILPDNGQIEVGTQFAIDASSDLDNQNKTDAYYIKFNDTGRQAWITFHGSWNSPNPVGYKLSVVNFTDSGEPVDALTSKTAAVDIFGNANNSVCPNDCFRPVAMALDSRGRIFLSSDATGEIYLVTRDESAAGTPTTSASSSTSSPSSATSSKTSAGVGMSSEYSSSVLILSWLSILAFIYM